MKIVFYIFKWLLVIFILTMMMSFTNYKNTEQVYCLTDINIINQGGYKFLNDNIIIESLDSYVLSGENQIIDNISASVLETNLKEHPSIQDAEVFFLYSGEVKIKIKSREPIIRVNNSQEDYYLDSDANIIPLSQNYTARVIVATGNITKEKYKKLIEFSQYVLADSLLKYQIIQIHIDNYNDIILIPRIGDHTITLGNFNNLRQKLNNLLLFYNKEFSVYTWDSYKDINLNFRNQIVCTKK
mgnify:CR=1 FL=1